MTAPVISVVMATYNHKPYVAQAIESVLKQRGVEFEFLIADDGSADATPRVVSSIEDARIRFFPHRDNRGACIVTNELIAHSSGEFIALINSDDRWIDEDKLAFQLSVLRNNPGVEATFGRARFIDKNGARIPKRELSFGNVFDQDNRSQGQWLRFFFEFGNGICHPTMLIRRSCYQELGGYNNNLRQLPDLDMWIRLVKRFQIEISERELIDFRVLPGKNASSRTVENSVRDMNERFLIASTFFDDVSGQQMKEGFGDLLRRRDVPSPVHLDIEKALLFFVPNRRLGRAYTIIGMLKLNHLLANRAHQQILKEDYGIDENWLHQKTAEIDVFLSRFKASLGLLKEVCSRPLRRIIYRRI